MKDGGRVLVVALVMAVLCCSAVTPLTPAQRHQLLLRDYYDDLDTPDDTDTQEPRHTETPLGDSLVSSATATTNTTTAVMILDEDLFQQTEDMLGEISDTLSQLWLYINNGSESDLVWQRLPYVWWREVVKNLIQPGDSPCIDTTGTCMNISITLHDIDQQLDTLTNNTDAWCMTNLKQLKENNKNLRSLMNEADDKDFMDGIIKKSFKVLLKKVKDKVNVGVTTAKDKVAETENRKTKAIIIFLSFSFSMVGLIIVRLLVGLYCMGNQHIQSHMTRKDPTGRHNTKVKGEYVFLEDFSI
ncbi:uncharacterized protein LOC121869695 [Homarus americanus]|uniref:Uncharacterized protein n=1 Tax=Homarus americanus TaxID=6706 RepID=A0A8J5JXK8_HOMAM|nr:uncharacterized protein LOC121869695 [Homarus americanus]KAG7166320.1 hypothetical protein Hamer_G011150 [Homarus americanus]